MANRQYPVSAAFTPVTFNETGTRQEPLSGGVIINETTSAAAIAGRLVTANSNTIVQGVGS